jgi:hypothetical protein
MPSVVNAVDLSVLTKDNALWEMPYLQRKTVVGSVGLHFTTRAPPTHTYGNDQRSFSRIGLAYDGMQSCGIPSRPGGQLVLKRFESIKKLERKRMSIELVVCPCPCPCLPFTGPYSHPNAIPCFAKTGINHASLPKRLALLANTRSYRPKCRT